MPTRSRTAATSSATQSQAFERRKVTSSFGSRPGLLEPQRVLQARTVAPQTAFASVSRSWIGVVSSGRAPGSSSFGKVIRNRRR